MSIKVNELNFSYSEEDEVLKDINFTLNDNEILGIVGPNGSGKSTLLKNINGILEPRTGNIKLNGKPIGKLSREDVAKIVGYVPQNESKEFPSTVFDTVLLGRKPYINWKPTSEDLKKVSNIIKLLGLQELSMRDIKQLSGGQKQKVMVARSLAQDPDILLLDEPTSDLDLKHQLEVLKIIEEQVKNGRSAVLAIHDLNLAGRYCDKILMLNNGEVYDFGGPEILSRENIETVYGVKVSVSNHMGRSLVVPEEPISG